MKKRICKQNNNKMIFSLKLHKINKRQDKTCFFLRVYYRDVKSLIELNIHIIQNFDFSVWDHFDQIFF